MKIYEQALEKFYEWLSTSGLKIVIGLLLVWIGFKIITRVIKAANKVMEKRNVDVTLASFLDGFMNICLKLLLVLMIMNYVGLSTSGIIALLGSAGIAVGLALKESLSNFAGGVIILFIRPFNVGDYIEGAGESGKVDKIGIFYTHMSTVDNKQILVPNGTLANGIVRNYTAQEMRRVDLTFCVGYDQDIRAVKNAIFSVINKEELILNEPEPFVAVSELADSSVNFITRVWTETDNYWKVYYSLLENVKIKFDEENISIPYPQMSIHVNKTQENTIN
ncbi:mechanosensitive ion channel family protein [Clostridium butyricum]|jgi:small conductance mechanosensitive channel|uniref:Mechanosensitive ion channel protein MscS n=1 Tax=Clostridium butyricum TaxID=1492 RepID=A0A2S7F7D4_CLOBU|nr:mechanosensitive ion channel domain-containing protein [Clostridium butyricum]ETI90156.1 MAG: Mechanosensitive ion channel family [Clostridium butyricum DORA_1]KHD16203.1 mechanosensitive ion channel protein MscS [Clostridium butyricum]MBS5981644.1 mechanosensitive ion channel [Clostridium butyricum]MBZ0311186.1 mechanosensitive ion channel [Clostridium butyricum]MDB2150420.1 mechanosensitive ion channel [Clostridium butyricum]